MPGRAIGFLGTLLSNFQIRIKAIFSGDWKPSKTEEKKVD